MSALKRKNSGEAASNKNHSKRLRTESKQNGTSKKLVVKKDEGAAIDNVKSQTTSILVKEQAAFPRGGAGSLTPLERKQINAQATRDAIAEHKKSGDLFGTSHHLGDDSDQSDDSTKADVAETKASKKKLKKSRKSKSTSDIKDDNIAIEGLAFKRIAVGSIILGAVSSINAHDLTIALPNNLTGFVPLTAISTNFTSKLQKMLEKDDGDVQELKRRGEGQDDDDNDDDDGDGDTTLSAHFREGQFVRAVVTSLGEEVAGKAQKKRIELALDPAKVNSGLDTSSLPVGATVQAAIVSIEDHGLVMDLGLGTGSASTGFVPVKELGTPTSLSNFRTGSVLLCTVTESSASSKVLKLSPRLSNSAVLKNAATVDAFLPGTLVEVLISEVAADGLAGKIIGMVDATADVIHSGSFHDRETFMQKYRIGQKVKGRVTSTFPLSDRKKIAISVLESIVNADDLSLQASDKVLISAVIAGAEVVRVVSGLGVFLQLSPSQVGFAHISRLSDKKVDSVGETIGPFKVGSTHKVRILDYNIIDGLYSLSLQKKIIEQKYLRIEDVPVGEIVSGTVQRLLIDQSGVQGLIVSLADGVAGMVPQIHLSDITLLHPEQKFREGGSVTARVLSVDKLTRRIRLTLKKTLVNSDQAIWTDLDNVEPGNSTIGTLIKVDPHGAIVQFYGKLRGFLPVSEMSEAYIKDATQHFKVGQVLAVNAISVRPAEQRLTLSCRDRSASSETSLTSVIPGTLVAGIVFEKSQADLLMRLDGSDVIARLPLEHVSDGSERKRRSKLDKIRVGQRLEDVVVLDIQRKGRLVNLTNKSSLVKATQSGQFLKSFEDLKEDALLTGFISNITEDGVFVRYANGISGMIPKRNVPAQADNETDFGLQTMQTVTAMVTSIDYRGATPRFWLTMREGTSKQGSSNAAEEAKPVEIPGVVNPVDETITSFSDLSVGRVIKARIASVKDTQINMELARDIQGRIDVSEIFDKWDDIKDRKQPLKSFGQKQILEVRILGAHDTRTHRFLPLTHRSGKNTVFELSAKPSVIQASSLDLLNLSDVQIGASFLAYVNNTAQDHLMVNISPSVRGRIKAIDVSDDINLAADLERNFPIGSAIRVRVLAVDVEKNRLDLTGRSSISTKPLSIEGLTAGMVLPGRITRVSDRSLLVQLSEDLIGAVNLIDMADDYDQCDVARFQKNDIVRVAVIKVDVPNKKVLLSTRPSKVLSSTLQVADPEIVSVDQLKVNDVVRGFITNIADKGIFVMLGHEVTAFVPVRHLSDLFLKNWKDTFQRDQLMRGKVILADQNTGHVQLSLKESLLDVNYKPPRRLADFKVGEDVTGKIAKVESFGVFVLVDDSENVRGLCHRSQIADGKTVANVQDLFQEGDRVKARILKIDVPNRRINFGLKASYFADRDDEDVVSDEDESEASVDGENDSDVDGGVDIDMEDVGSSPDDSEEDGILNDGDEDGSNDGDVVRTSGSQRAGLSVGGFDWYGTCSGAQTAANDAGKKVATPQKKSKSKSTIQEDLTADLDTHGPQSTDDFERLLLGSPMSSILWKQYMAFHIELGDIDAARSIGERALNTMGLNQEAEKLEIWIALLNLENAYGDDESLEATFRRACEVNDSQEIYNRLTSIYILSGKHNKADDLLQEMLKRFTQDSNVYVNYASFLFDTMGDADRGRALLVRAQQVLHVDEYFDLTSRFAQLEFKSRAGLAERGRTVFEGLLNSAPTKKRGDILKKMLDMEIKHGRANSDGQTKTHETKKNGKATTTSTPHVYSEESKQQIRSVFERILDHKLKPKTRNHYFDRWEEFEEENGDDRQLDEVKSRRARLVK